ncbi:hypothetical protein CLOM_g3444, partial [Closterium sp. NIES-68]
LRPIGIARFLRPMAAAARGADADVDDYMGDLSAFLPPEDATKLRDAQLQQQKKQTKQHRLRHVSGQTIGSG